jgi:hypothetical protein
VNTSVVKGNSDGLDHVVARTRLFSLLKEARLRGVTFAKVGELERHIELRTRAVFLKHDIHGMDLDALADFAAEERRNGISATYFFMAPDHPHTATHYAFADQARVMLSIQDMGHQIGLHVDPYFLIDKSQSRFSEVLENCLAMFLGAGIQVTACNMHGNSQHKGRDRNGRGTSFDLFEEIARQPDFPALADVPPEIAEIIRSNRVSLMPFGITHWCDQPLWSAKHRFVVTNYVSDNNLGKNGRIEVTVHEQCVDQWVFSDAQLPGARTKPVSWQALPLSRKANFPEYWTGTRHLDFSDAGTADIILALANHPLNMLIHPQYYV